MPEPEDRPPLWPFPVAQEIIEVLEWRTDLLQSQAGEQRIALRSRPREIVTFQHRCNALGMARAREIWPGEFSGHGTGEACPAGRHGMFVQMLGAGFDAQVVHRISLPLKRRLGAMAYALQAGRELARYGFAPIRVRVDGADHEAASVIVTKGSLYGGRYMLAPDMAPTRPGFTVALFQHAGPMAALCYGAALPLGLLPHMPGVRLLPAQEVVIDGPAVPLQTDGDMAGRAPIHIVGSTRPIPIVVA